MNNNVLLLLFEMICLMVAGYYFGDFIKTAFFKKGKYTMYDNGPTMFTYDSLSKMRMCAEAVKLEEYKMMYKFTNRTIKYDDNTEDTIDALLILADFTVYGYKFDSQLGQLIPLEINYKNICLDVVQRESDILYMDYGYLGYKPDARLSMSIIRYNDEIYRHFSDPSNIDKDVENKRLRFVIVGYILC